MESALRQHYSQLDIDPNVTLEHYITAWRLKKGADVKELLPHVDEEVVLSRLSLEESVEYEIYQAIRDGSPIEEIAQVMGKAIRTIYRRRLSYIESGMVEERRGSLPKVTDEELLEEIVSYPHTFGSLAAVYDTSATTVKKRLQGLGLTREDFTKWRAFYKNELRQSRRKLVDQLMQHYFDRLIEEKGIDYALAWRLVEFTRFDNYPLEIFEQLIASRRRINPKTGNQTGIYTCIKNAGLGMERQEIEPQQRYVKKALDAALHDVSIDLPKPRAFKHGQSFTSEEKDMLRSLRRQGLTCREIGEMMGRSTKSILSQQYRMKIKPTQPRETFL